MPSTPTVTYDDLAADIALNIWKYLPLDFLTRLKQVNHKFAEDMKYAISTVKVFDETTFSSNMLRKKEFDLFFINSILHKGHGEIIKFDFALFQRRDNKIAMALAACVPNIADIGFITYVRPDFNTFEESLNYCEIVKHFAGNTPVKRIGLRLLGGTRSLVVEGQLNRIITVCPNLECIKIVYAKCRTLSMVSLIRCMVKAVKELPNLKRITLITECDRSRKILPKLVYKKVMEPEVRVKLFQVIKHKFTWYDEKEAYDRIEALRYTITCETPDIFEPNYY